MNIRFLILLSIFFFGLSANPLSLSHPEATYGSLSGLPLKHYPKTTYALILADDSVRFYISLGFLAQDMENYEGFIKQALAKDVQSGTFFDASEAHYVVNSDAKGTFSRYGKFAFKNRDDARAFTQKHGGAIRNFSFTLYMANRDHAEDLKSYNARKLHRDYPTGQGIYRALCPTDLNTSTFFTLATLKTHLKKTKTCGDLHEFHLHALALYLQEAKDKPLMTQNRANPIDVPQKAKCPVCGMFVAKYPRWAAQIDMGEGHSFYFDGVKDMMKFIRSPLKYTTFTQGKPPQNIYVTDYYTLDKIKAQSAYYVIGSLVYGPMGHELIPFIKEEDARGFMRDHAGRRILRFEEMTSEVVYGLDQ